MQLQILWVQGLGLKVEGFGLRAQSLRLKLLDFGFYYLLPEKNVLWTEKGSCIGILGTNSLLLRYLDP